MVPFLLLVARHSARYSAIGKLRLRLTMTQTRKRLPASLTTGPDDGIGQRIHAARIKAKLSKTDLHRATGISRTVLAKYETGDYKPGTGELRRLCDALRVTPNELVYGNTDPFHANGPFSAIDADDAVGSTVATAVIVSSLPVEDRKALLTVARQLIEARHGTESLQKLDIVWPRMAEALAGQMTQLDQLTDAAIDNRAIRDLQRELKQLEKGSPKSRKRRARRPAPSP